MDSSIHRGAPSSKYGKKPQSEHGAIYRAKQGQDMGKGGEAYADK